MIKDQSRIKKAILIFTLAALVLLHLLLVIPAVTTPVNFMEIDSYEYLDLALGLKATGRYQGLEMERIDLIRPPGYPLFLVLGLFLGNDYIKMVPLMQVGLLLLAAGLIYLTGREVGAEKAGIAGAVIYLLNPNAAFWSMSLMTETQAGFLLILAVWCGARYWKTRQWGWLLAAGLSLSAGAITRPLILPLAVALTLLFALLEVRVSSGRGLKTGLLLAAGVYALVLPWQVRNAVVHDRFTLSQVDEATFQNWIVSKTLADIEGITRSDAVAMISQAHSPWRFSFEFILQHPVPFAKDQIRGISRTILGAEYATWAKSYTREAVPTSGMLSEILDDFNLSGLLNAFYEQLKIPWFWAGLYALAFDGIMYGMCLVGIWKGLALRRRGPIFNLTCVLVLSLAFLILLPAGAGESRFRAPADPLLGTLAGLALLDRGDRT